MTTTAQQRRAEYDPEALERLGATRKRATAMLAEIQGDLREQVIAAGFAGISQVEVVNVTGITRENVRVMWRDAGVPPRK